MSTHPGTTLDIKTQQGIAVHVRAYRTPEGRRIVNGCPEFGADLDAKDSDQGTGRFALRIPADVQNYVVTYCQIGYYAREEQFNTNTPDGVPVAAAPIELIPMAADAADLSAALRHDILRLANTVAYLRQSEPAQYNAIVDRTASFPELKSLNVTAFVDQLQRVRPAQR